MNDPPRTLFPSAGDPVSAADKSTDPRATTPTDARPPAVSAPAVPGFEIVGELGRGGMGVVYLARQVELNREVALKMILAGGYALPAELTRFVQEAESVARVRHPNVVEVFHAGRHAGLPYFVMEYVPGGSLAGRLREGPLPPREAAALVEQVARGVGHCHARDVLHRDLKPANILLAADGTPKVTDFGLAKRADAGGELTASGAVMGTPSYMAPEQAAGGSKRIGPAADVYGLGAVLYACLTGRPPFAAPTPHETIYQVIAADPAAPRSVQPGTPRDLETVCLKCLEKDPGKRYPSGEALADDLARYLRGEPVAARRAGPAERGWKWVKRNRIVAGFAAVLAGLLAAGTVTFALLYLWADRQRGSAETARDDAVTAAGRADAARKGTQALNDFLVAKVLSAARPVGEDNGLGRDVTVLAAVEAASADLSAAFAGQPELEANVRQAVGETFRIAGSHDRAEPHLIRAVELYERLGGPGDPNRVNALNGLSHLRYAQGRFAESERTAREVWDRRRAAGAPARDVLLAANNVAEALDGQGRYGEAVPLLEEARAGWRAAGLDELGAYTLDVNLGNALSKLGRPAEAEPLLREAAPGVERLAGPNHPLAIAARHNLAALCVNTGRSAEAESLGRRALAGHEAVRGPDHPQTLAAAGVLAAALADQRKAGEALPFAERAFAGRLRKLGPTHPDTLNSQYLHARCVRDVRGPAAAEPLARANLAAHLAAFGPTHPSIASVTELVGEVAVGLGRTAEAEELLRRVVDLRRKDGTITIAAGMNSLNTLGGIYLETGRPADALPLVTEALAILRPNIPPGHPQVAVCATLVGWALTDAGRPEEAEPLLREALAIREKALPPGDYRTGVTRSVLGECLSARGRPAEAEPYLRTGAEVLTRAAPGLTPTARPRVTEAVRRLVRFYERQGKAAAAAEWARKLPQRETAPRPRPAK